MKNNSIQFSICFNSPQQFVKSHSVFSFIRGRSSYIIKYLALIDFPFSIIAFKNWVIISPCSSYNYQISNSAPQLICCLCGLSPAAAAAAAAIVQKRLKKEKKAKRKLQEALEYESKRREQAEQTLKQPSPSDSLRSLNGQTLHRETLLFTFHSEGVRRSLFIKTQRFSFSQPLI